MRFERCHFSDDFQQVYWVLQELQIGQMVA